MKLRDKLIELNIDVPDPIAPAGNYVPYKIINGFIYISGQVPVVGSITSGNIITGRVPSEVSVSKAKEAAKICIININILYVILYDIVLYSIDIICYTLKKHMLYYVVSDFAMAGGQPILSKKMDLASHLTI